MQCKMRLVNPFLFIRFGKSIRRLTKGNTVCI
jgi:hypothetical protein